MFWGSPFKQCRLIPVKSFENMVFVFSVSFDSKNLHFKSKTNHFFKTLCILLRKYIVCIREALLLIINQSCSLIETNYCLKDMIMFLIEIKVCLMEMIDFFNKLLFSKEMIVFVKRIQAFGIKF